MNIPEDVFTPDGMKGSYFVDKIRSLVKELDNKEITIGIFTKEVVQLVYAIPRSATKQ